MSRRRAIRWKVTGRGRIQAMACFLLSLCVLLTGTISPGSRWKKASAIKPCDKNPSNVPTVALWKSGRQRHNVLLDLAPSRKAAYAVSFVDGRVPNLADLTGVIDRQCWISGSAKEVKYSKTRPLFRKDVVIT